MKKIFLYFNLAIALIFSGCSNTNINDTLSSISDTLESKINNLSSLIGNFNQTKSIDVKKVNSKYFEIENYKFAFSNDHIGIKGIEAVVLIDFDKKVEQEMFLKIEFPVYNSKGKKVTNGLLTKFIYGKGPRRIIEKYGEFSYNEKLFINPEEIITTVYMNKKIIATTNNASRGKTSQVKKAEFKKVRQEKELINKTETASKQIRQTRQSVKR